MHVRIKICGITRVEHAHWAIDAGADAIGLVFYPPSPRVVDIEQAREIVAEVSPFVSVVGVFANQGTDDVGRIVENVRLDLLQFHGDETPQLCESFNRPWLKGIRMHPDLVLAGHMSRYSAARGVLVDSWKSGTMGGTGSAFDWQRLKTVDRQKLVLAGGLDASNVSEAITQVRPAGIDISSGVEVEPGVKSKELIDGFMQSARAAH